MVMMVILVLGTLAILVNSLGSVSKTIQRNEKTAAALNQAKEALIAYAVSNSDSFTERPGDLPCPDRHLPNNPDGTPNPDYGKSGPGSSCSSGGKTTIGRLPWKTLGIPELVDATGEPLWYSLSDNFRTTAGTIYSDTQGTFSVYDQSNSLVTPAGDKAAAVIFAAGSALNGQSRSSSQTALCSTTNTTIAQYLCATNYLETSNSRNNATVSGPYIAADTSDTFNDHLAYIPVSQLMSNVGKRVAGELKNHLADYYDSWHGYPFSAPFTNPASAAYTGNGSDRHGLYPFGGINSIGTPPTTPTWTSATNPTLSNGDSISAPCSIGSSNTRIRCTVPSSGTFTVPAGVEISFTGTLQNVGLGFWLLYDSTYSSQVGVRATSSSSYVIPSSIFDKVSPTTDFISASLNSSGTATVTFRAKGKSPGGSTFNRIQILGLQYDNAPLPTWFASNNWNRAMFYASSYTSLSVNNQAASAVVIATGSALANQSRATNPNAACAETGTNIEPVSCIDNYLEGSNATPASNNFESRFLANDFNDNITPVSP